MSSSDIKPWYKNDVANTVRSLYFAKRTSMQQRSSLTEKERNMQWYGALCGWSSVLLAVGIEPSTIFTEQDIEFMQNMSKGN